MEQLTDEDTNYIVESLLFSLCLEVVDKWTLEDRLKMLNLAKTLRTNSTTLKNIDLYIFEESENSIATDVANSFPELNLIKDNF